MSERYPALMTYIAERSAVVKWCDQLREDEASACGGAFADVVADLAQAEADYAAARVAQGCNPYPYNRDMGVFLGLSIRDNGEPPHGYYMARRVAAHHRLGAAERAVAGMIAEGRPLAVVTARSKADGRPVRFARFAGPDQIRIAGNGVILSDGKRIIRLSSNWSVESCLVAVADCMRSGRAWGERKP